MVVIALIIIFWVDYLILKLINLRHNKIILQNILWILIEQNIAECEVSFKTAGNQNKFIKRSKRIFCNI